MPRPYTLAEVAQRRNAGEDFRRRLIFTEAEPLRRARMPTGPQLG